MSIVRVIESLARLNPKSVCILCTICLIVVDNALLSDMQPSTKFAVDFVPKTIQQRPNRQYYCSLEYQEEFNKLSGW